MNSRNTRSLEKKKLKLSEDDAQETQDNSIEKSVKSEQLTKAGAKIQEALLQCKKECDAKLLELQRTNDTLLSENNQLKGKLTDTEKRKKGYKDAVIYYQERVSIMADAAAKTLNAAQETVKAAEKSVKAAEACKAAIIAYNAKLAEFPPPSP